MGTVTVVCAWCKPKRVVIREKPTPGQPDSVSDGICRKHAEQFK